MLRITGYSDKYWFVRGKKSSFMSTPKKNEDYQVDIVRLIHGDTNPEGPGFKEKVVRSSCNKKYKGKTKKFMVAPTRASNTIIE